VFAGPLFTREVLTAPRQWKHFLLRAGYVAAFAVLLYTAGQATFGFQKVRNVGDIARFGSYVFSLAAFLQLSLVMAAALLFSANTVAQEKDKRTLILLLMTDLHSRELVLGKLLGSLLPVVTLIGVSLPVLCFIRLLGGVTLPQVLWLEALCLAAGLAAGSWGTLVAYWREKTFQTIAVTVLGAVLFLGVVELCGTLLGAEAGLGRAIALLNPYRALGELLHPLARQPDVAQPVISAWEPVAALSLLAIGLIVAATLRVRVWNPSRSIYEQVKQAAVAEATTRSRHRGIWTNPVIWREICTRAYGRKMLVVKGAYFVLAGLLALWVSQEPPGAELVLGMMSRSGAAFAMLTVVGLLLVTAQAVTALTSERDGQTLELLLVTDVTAREFIFGKLGGILYNTKEVLLAPLLFLVVYAARGSLRVEDFIYLLLGLTTLAGFCAMLGLHSGLSYDVSRQAILQSLGTVFFLFVGTFLCLVMIVEARASFALQFGPFLVFIVGGGVGLWASLGHKNPSTALFVAAILLPFLTFYALTGYLLGNTLGVALSVLAAYGFTTIAMLIPAVSEFDYALGRTTLDRG
jgi:ABC-type transport system involved in multi-copper enzyme maturation permease subunit